MEELLEIKQYLLEGNLTDALALVEELEAMGRQAAIDNLESFLVILLIHLIKNQVEKRLTTSWKRSIINSLVAIQKKNKLGKKAHYINKEQWDDYLENNLPTALLNASYEVFGGMEYKKLKASINKQKLFKIAKFLLSLSYLKSQDELIVAVNDELDHLS